MLRGLEPCVARRSTTVPLLELRLGIQVTTANPMVLFRNDMDVVGVRAGCIFTGFSGSAFNGNSVVVSAEQWDKWVVFSRCVQADFFHWAP